MEKSSLALLLFTVCLPLLAFLLLVVLLLLLMLFSYKCPTLHYTVFLPRS